MSGETKVNGHKVRYTNLNIGYTGNDGNPVDDVSFYKLTDINKKFKLKKERISELLPEKFNEKITRVFCKNLNKLTEVQLAFDKFIKYHNLYEIV